MKIKFKKKRILNSRILIFSLSAAAVILIAANIVFVVLYLSERKSDVTDSEAAFAPSDDADVLRGELEAAVSERDELQKRLSEYENSDTSDYSDLISKIDEKNSYISWLEENIELLQGTYAADAKNQARLFSELSDLVANPVLIEEEIEKSVKTDNGFVTASVTESRMPKLSLCYLDLESGYTFSFNGDLQFDSASVVKAPYILSILKSASAEFSERQQKLVDGVSEEDLGAPYYDFTKSIVYSEGEYYQPGTGVIASRGDGISYTFSDLIGYTLSDSDNVAFHVLTAEYGHTLLRSLVREEGWTSMYDTTINMSARDGCSIMKSIYEFTESGAEYSSLMKNSLIGSSQPNLTMTIGGGRDVAHKYGWDDGSYHDIGIVYDEHPYAVAIFSDYDGFNSDHVLYMQKLLRLVDELHAAYYDGIG